MNSNMNLQKAKEFCNLGYPYKALELLRQHQLNTKDYYVLLADIYMMLSNYKMASAMYSNSIIAYTKEESDGFKLISFKGEIRHKIMEADKLLSFTNRSVAQYCYDDKNRVSFMDLKTFEIIDVLKDVVKYVQLEEMKEYILITDSRTNTVMNVIEQE